MLDKDGTRPLRPDQLTVVLPPEVAAVVGQGRFRVTDVALEPGYHEAFREWQDVLGSLQQHEESLRSHEEWKSFWLADTHDTATMRIAEPIGKQLGYFGIYRGRPGAIGSMGGENLTGLCAYDDLLDPAVRAEPGARLG